MMQNMLQSGLRFDDATHKYFVGDAELPSVTTILKDVGLIDDRWYTKAGSDRGTDIHTILELFDQGDLNWEALTDKQLVHVQNWANFLAEFQTNGEVRVEAIELPLYHVLYKYAGTLDRLITSDNKWYVVDIKSGGKSRWHQLQLTFYAMLVETITSREVGIVAVYTKTGKWEILEKNYSTCEAILKVYNWKHGRS